jgi:GTPase SAR1 family protein
LPANGVKYLMEDVVISDKRYRFDIWDTASQEKFRGFTPIDARGASPGMVVFDVSEQASFEQLDA